jgi:hypothetical protein
MPYDPTQPMSADNHGDGTQIINGKPYTWQPTTTAQDAFNYLGQASGYNSAEEAQAADEQNGDGTWAEASFKNPNGTMFGPSWMLPAMLAGPALAAGAGAAFGGGAAAAGGGGATIGAGAGTAAATVPAGMGAAGAGTAAGVTGAGGSIGAGLGTTAGMGVTGGTLSALGKVGTVAGNYAANAAKGRAQEATINNDTDQLRQRQAEAERANNLATANLGVTQRTTGQALESQAQRQALLGLLMQGAAGHADPGSGYTAMSVPGKGALGAQLNQMAMDRLNSGSDKQWTAPPNVATPTLTPPPQPSKLDKLMQIAGLVGSAAGAFGGG